MNLQINKTCSLCIKGKGVFRKHAYTVYNKTGKPVQLENCGFIACDFCGVQTPDAPTVYRIVEAKETE